MNIFPTNVITNFKEIPLVVEYKVDDKLTIYMAGSDNDDIHVSLGINKKDGEYFHSYKLGDAEDIARLDIIDVDTEEIDEEHVFNDYDRFQMVGLILMSPYIRKKVGKRIVSKLESVMIDLYNKLGGSKKMLAMYDWDECETCFFKDINSMLNHFADENLNCEGYIPFLCEWKEWI